MAGRKNAPPEHVSCSFPPCPIPLLGDVGTTLVSGRDNRTGKYFEPYENIYGAFENGFGVAQRSVLASLGCADGEGYVEAGIDTETAEAVVAHDCNVTLPRIDGQGRYISMLVSIGFVVLHV